MNFLSHYYFERYTLDSEQVLGSLLPDLLKNVDKGYIIQIHKHYTQLDSFPELSAIIQGWEKHIEVDRIFHNTDFFYHHTHQLRLQIAPIIMDLPVRPSFLAHISLELLLDHLLIANDIVSVQRLYEHLETTKRPLIKKYFDILGIIDEVKFFKFYDRFLESKYIFDYSKVDNLPYALFNICKRIWNFDVLPSHFEELATILDKYQETSLKDYHSIYTEIQYKIEL